jgi:hypothetical protein
MPHPLHQPLRQTARLQHLLLSAAKMRWMLVAGFGRSMASPPFLLLLLLLLLL